MPNLRGRDNLIPGVAAKVKPRRTDTLVHLRFVVWAMTQPDIDAITVRRVKNVLGVAMPTAQKLRDHWRMLTSTRFYRDSVPDIINVQRQIFGLGEASNEG